MTVTARNLKQTVTHWAVTGSNGFGGYTFGTPTKLNARWQNDAQMYRDGNGEEVVSNAIVYLSADVAVGDYLGEGDLTATADPTTLSDVYRVRRYYKTSDLRNLDVLRKAIL